MHRSKRRGPCEPSPTPFSVEAELTEARVLDLMDAYPLDDRAALDCEVVCDAVREGGYGFTDYTGCTLDVAEATGDDPDEIVGFVACGGSETRGCR